MSYFLNDVFVIPSNSKIKVEIDLSNYATKSDFKNATGVDPSKIAKKLYLTSLKSETDGLDIDKLEKVPIDFNIFKSKADKLDVDNQVLVPTNLSKLTNVVINEVVKKTVQDELVKNVNAIDTGGLVKLVQKMIMT